MKTTFSIVIPFYNRGLFLENTLLSIYKQTYRPLELILIDNGSTDNSIEICKDFQLHHNTDNFKVIINQELKKGANSARNKGLQLASGEYISFYDSDDEMIPQRMELIAQKAYKTKADVIASTTIFKYPDGSCKPRLKVFSSSVEKQILTAMLSTQSFTVRKAFFLNIGGWNEKVFRWQDWEVGIRILLNTQNIAWIKHPALDYIFTHNDSITGNNFHSSYHELTAAITEAIKAVNTSNYKHKKRALRLLHFRRLWLAGMLYHEKEIAKYQECITLFHSESRHSLYTNAIFKLLLAYIKAGGKGAWRLAHLLLYY